MFLNFIRTWLQKLTQSLLYVLWKYDRPMSRGKQVMDSHLRAIILASLDSWPMANKFRFTYYLCSSYPISLYQPHAHTSDWRFMLALLKSLAPPPATFSAAIYPILYCDVALPDCHVSMRGCGHWSHTDRCYYMYMYLV